jgi:hypothetical protein
VIEKYVYAWEHQVMIMRRFLMHRKNDESGVSGTGCVLAGVVFEEGECVIRWRGLRGSVNVFKCYADFLAIHVTSHPSNGTEIIFEDGAKEVY